MQKELTYILGAGASFQSMPTVKSFPGRFGSFVEYLLSLRKSSDVFRDVHEKAKKTHAAFKTHQSFDTYFKKLFHTGQAEKITETKKILNIYFIWEHLSTLQDDSEIFVGEYTFGKQSTVHPRSARLPVSQHYSLAYGEMIKVFHRPLSARSLPGWAMPQWTPGSYGDTGSKYFVSLLHDTNSNR